MPKGIPVATFAIGEAGAAYAALPVIAILAAHDLISADAAAELSAKVSPRVLGGATEVGRLDVMI